MNPAQKTLLALLKCALRGERYIGDSEQDWNAVYAEAVNQTVTAMAAKALPPTLSREDRAQWKKAEYCQAANYIRYLAAQDELCRLFRENEIPMAILKGAAAAVYYPQPSLRAMGDIDLIVSHEQYRQAKTRMLENGYEEEHESKRHSDLRKNGFEFELHRRFSRGTDIDTLITEGMRELTVATIDGHAFPILPRFANGMVLLDHMRAHLESGMGLRQLIDWMMFVERELDDEFWNSSFHAAAKEKKLDRLAIAAAGTCRKYLGLSTDATWFDGADEQLCDDLMENLLFTGNFGTKNGAGRKVEMVKNSIRQYGFLGNLQKAGLSNWKAVDQYPWLRSFAWAYQIFRYTGQLLRAKRGGKIIEDMKRSDSRYELLKRLGIY